MGRLTRDGTAETVSGDQILRRERGQGNINFPCSADHEPPYSVDPYSCCICGDHTCLTRLILLLLYVCVIRYFVDITGGYRK